MAKVRGPLLSIDGRGAIAKSQVYASWRGVPYVRQFVTPSNPRTTAQTLTRDVFTAVDDQWKRMLTLAQAPWNAAAAGRPFVPRNALMSSNIPVLRSSADMSPWVGSPGVLGGLPLVTMTAATGAAGGEIDISYTTPPAPIGWTFEAIVMTAAKDRDPALRADDFMTEQEDTTTTADASGSTTLTGLATGTAYFVSAWTRWTRADGKTAYGPSTTAIATSG